MKDVDESTPTFVLTPRNEVILAGAKGKLSVLFADTLGKKAERRAALAEEGLRKAETASKDVRLFGGKCASDEEIPAKVNSESPITHSVPSADLWYKWNHSLARTPLTLLQFATKLGSGISPISPSIPLPCFPDLSYDDYTCIITMPSFTSLVMEAYSMGEWVAKEGFFAKVVSQTAIEPEVLNAKMKMKIVAIEIATSIVAATTLCEAMQAIQETIRQSPEPAFKPTMTSDSVPSPMTIHNQGALQGSQKREMLGKYTVEKLVDGAFQRVNFDKQRTLVFNHFLQTQVSSEEYKAAAPPGNYRPPKTNPNVIDVQRYMGVYALKMICAVASTLKIQLGEDEVPSWADLAYPTAGSNQSDCTKNWIAGMSL